MSLDGTKKQAKLNLVDLAGSENVKESGAKGIVLQEAGQINKSLTALSVVINKIVQNEPHIPYKDTKLTHILSDSLGGNSLTTFICTVRRSESCIHNSLWTLRFG